MNTEELLLQDWSKTLSWDYALDDEFYSSNIVKAFENNFINVSPKVQCQIVGFKIFNNEFGRLTVTFDVLYKLKSKYYHQLIRIYSPKISRTKDLESLLQSEILSIKPICLVYDCEFDRHVLVAECIKTKSSTGQLRNITLQEQEDCSDVVLQAINNDLSYKIYNNLIDNYKINKKDVDFELFSEFMINCK